MVPRPAWSDSVADSTTDDPHVPAKPYHEKKDEHSPVGFELEVYPVRPPSPRPAQ